jgi:hypothetical protein
MIAGDHPLSIAFELNQRGYRNAQRQVDQLKIFQMLPRVIELGPEILFKRDGPTARRGYWRKSARLSCEEVRTEVPTRV